MPRGLPRLAVQFSDAVIAALDLLLSIEQIFASQNIIQRRASGLSIFKIELIYELCYLRIFLAWEEFLEESFIRYMCGYTNSIKQEAYNPGTYCASMAAAIIDLYGGADYLLWHNPETVIRRAQHWFTNSNHEMIISSISPRLKHYSSIRHRIVHSQIDAKNNFDTASLHLAGKTYPAGRPGRFLRDRAPGLPPLERWISTIGSEFIRLALQIAP